MSYQVGQTVFMVPSQRYMGKPRDVVISKVGRVWVEVEGGKHRFNKETGAVEAINSGGGRIYATAAEYHEEVKHQERLSKIRNRFEWYARDSITREQALQIAEILGISDDDEAKP